MESRDLILESLRKGRGASTDSQLPAINSAEIYADLPDKDLFEYFSAKLKALRGEAWKVDNMSQAAKKLQELLPKGSSFAFQKSALFEKLFSSDFGLGAHLGTGQVIDEKGLEHNLFADCQIGFSLADALVARTGSVLLKSTSAGGRRLSVLPETHVVIAETKQLIPSLSSWLRAIPSDKDWSYACVITGPSRTADIERIIVFGAHGPRKLIVLLMDE